jgi:glycosyltransferase involved in cell wall biosynthesis
MYHSDLLGGIAAAIVGNVPVVWNIRRGSLKKDVTKTTTRWVAKACAVAAAHVPARIVCCSESAACFHAQFGYPRDKITIISNGFELGAFRADPIARGRLRANMGIPQDAIVIGLVARFHPTKGHANFLSAANLLLRQYPDTHFILCGNDVLWNNPALARAVEAAGTADRFHFEGRRGDIPQILAAVDIAASSSIVEGFPNVVGEAMACEKPCVVTDVGDCAYLVGDTGIVVPPACPEKLAAAWAQLIEAGADERLRLGRAARRRVEENFSIEEIALKYEDVYKEVTKRCAA